MLPNMELRDGRSFDIALHRYKSTTIIEFEPSGSETQPLGTARKMVDRIREADTVESLISRTTRLVKATLGYDRVMIYRFEDDGAGKVVSEAKQPELESFLGQYFPASDIPQQARTLYLKTHCASSPTPAEYEFPYCPPSMCLVNRSICHSRICAAFLPSIVNIFAIWALLPPCRFR